MWELSFVGIAATVDERFGIRGAVVVDAGRVHREDGMVVFARQFRVLAALCAGTDGHQRKSIS